jgi:hypothetical protein
MNRFMGFCLYESAVNMYWKCFNCGLSGTKALSVPDVVFADLHTIRKHRQHDQSSNGYKLSDQQVSESSPAGLTSSGIILLTTNSLSGMIAIQYRIKVSCLLPGNVVSSPAMDIWPSLLSVICCQVEIFIIIIIYSINPSLCTDTIGCGTCLVYNIVKYNHYT